MLTDAPSIIFLVRKDVIMNCITKEIVQDQGVKPLKTHLYLDPLSRVLLECLQIQDGRNGSDLIRRLIQAEAQRRGIWSPPDEPPWSRLTGNGGDK